MERYCQQHAEEAQPAAWQSKETKSLGKRERQPHELLYNTARWQRVRMFVLRRHPACQAEGCRSLASEVDHIQPISEGGAQWHESNLQALCKPCHTRKTAEEARRRKAAPLK